MKKAFDKNDNNMGRLTVTVARKKLYELIDQVTTNHEPFVITGERGNAVVVSEEYWTATIETLNLQ